ncbi:MAG: CRP/FNR family cyclic AMP-dependent transcriptional regulator [Candidatus Azotimanducaceae bacterium]|jgi:CRP/FNR family cyclic AMP-dependent transcriptional regulator
MNMKRLEPITSSKALDILNKVHFFNVFNSQEKDILTGFHSHFFLVKKGEAIIRQGGQDRSFYILLSGRVNVVHKDLSKALATLVPGDFFGEVSFLTERVRTTSIFSSEDCIVFEIDRATLTYLDIAIREKLKDNIIKVLVNRLDHLNKTIVQLNRASGG